MKAFERTTNVKRNIIFGFIQVVVSQFFPFITRTVLIYYLGAEYLGLNSFFTSVLSVLSLMELGFGTAVVYCLYRPIAEKDTVKICAYLYYYRKVYGAIGLAILIAGLILLPFLPYLVKDTAIPGNININICYLIFLSDSVISYLLFGYVMAIPSALQRRDLLSKIDIGMAMLKCIVQSLIILCSSSYYLYLIALPLTTIVRNIVTAYIIRKKYPNLMCKGALNIDQKRDIRKKVHGILINKLTGVSRNSIDTICITSLLGLTMAGIYNNYFFVFSGVIAFSNMISNSMKASVGNSIVVESKEKNYDDMRLFDFIYTIVAGWATACLLCLCQPFIIVWVGPDMMMELPAVIGLCIYFYILKSGDIRWVYQEGTGQWYECRFIMVGEAVINILLNIILCRLWGVLGIVLATVFSVFITNTFFCPRVLFLKYFMNGKLVQYWRDHTLYTLTMLTTTAASWAICENVLPISMLSGLINSIYCLGGRLLVCACVSIVGSWLIWRKSEIFGKMIVWIKIRNTGHKQYI